MKKLFDFREEYKTGELNESGVKANPMEQFQLWLQADYCNMYRKWKTFRQGSVIKRNK